MNVMIKYYDHHKNKESIINKIILDLKILIRSNLRNNKHQNH